ncbi:MAG: hypothetical protein A3H98_09645 [Bacteroidetes bacterium RIFCSPLOWO2_02_FULL_36_8]|nr:MAG: hypothetical protein A3H98_09645 [Bacteroidetes bacterium RIFCSPLOWO2_02_FULL_36_8]OFY69290.1 MAG: hypothetical protein A3G23_02370 [Bacteroidetes bacterium RIFCSPLOWO2_12_FULL_37_12]
MTLPVFAQKQGLGFHYYHGNIFRDSRQMVHLIKGFPNMYEFQWKYKRTGISSWERVYNFPFTDIAVIITDFANKNDLGYAISIIPQLQILFYEKSFLSPSFTAGTGVSYLTKIFHPVENPLNVTFGSRFNIVLHGYLGLQLRIKKNFLMDVGYGITHFSNGNIKEPNTGLNLILWKAGLNYLFFGKTLKNISDTIAIVPLKNFYSIRLNQSFKQLPSAGNKFFYIVSVSGNYNYPLTNLGYITTGFDLFMDYAVKYLMINETTTYKSSVQLFRSGITAGYVFKINRVEIPVQFGYYIYLPFKNVTSTYQRAGVQYAVTKNFTAGLYLKTHYGHADYLEWTAGWGF